jgi:hypothetical protein
MAAARADTVGLSGTRRTKADGLTHEATGFPPEAVDERIAVVRAASGPRDLELHALIRSDQAALEVTMPSHYGVSADPRLTDRSAHRAPSSGAWKNRW